MIGAKLKNYRESLKFTGEVLSGLAGIKRSWLSQIENEKKYPPMDTFMNLVEAIAHTSIINEKNKDYVLSDKNFVSFLKLTSFFVKIPNAKWNQDDDSIGWYQNISDLVKYSSLITDDAGVCTILCRLSGYSPIFKIYIFPENFNDSYEMIAEIKKELKKFFMREAFTELISNTEEKPAQKMVVYHFEEVRETLFEWWYNSILQDFYYSFRYAMNNELALAEEEVIIFNKLSSLINHDGTFTPFSDEDITNIPKSLLNEKTVTFDISYIKDKNLKLTLDGKLLSNQEIEILDVSLSAIRYKRDQK